MDAHGPGAIADDFGRTRPVLSASGTFRTLELVVQGIVLVALLGELGLVLLNVAMRTFFHMSFLWIDEVARLALATLAFVGGALAYRRGEHTSVRALINRLPLRAQGGLLALADCLVLVIGSVAGFSAVSLIQTSWNELTPILQMPVATLGMPLLLSMALVTLYALERMWTTHRKHALLPTVVLLLALLVLSRTHDDWTELLTGNRSIWVTLAFLLATVLTGLPVGFALALASAAYLWMSSSAPMVALAQNMVNGTGNFILLAIPFFVVAGLVMERGGLSIRLVNFVFALVGHLRGGLLQVMVVSMYLVSGLSGSKSADVAAVGSVMRDMLRREKVDLAEATAALAASAAMGETIPPSIAMLILGSVTSLSIAGLFIGGLIPAAAIAACLMVLIYVDARRGGKAKRRGASWSELRRSSLHAILPLVMPAMLFAGILLGFATPTEISAFAVIYGVTLAAFVYREMDFASLIRTTVDGAALTGMILFILAAASSFSWVLTIADLPPQLVDLLQSSGNESSLIFLVGSIILLIVTGSLLEGLPALNVMAPLLMPLALKLGINQLHYGIVLIISMGVGAFMPPTGVGFYVCCAIMRIDIERASRAMLPYFAVLVGGLLIVTFVPWLTLVLPRLFGFAV